MTVSLALIVLKDYREWVESLGYDREWLVQATQSAMTRHLTLEYSNIGAFSCPLTYDSYLVVLNSIRLDEFSSATRRIEKKAPRGLLVYIGSGEDYANALDSIKPLELATRAEKFRTTMPGVSIVAHVDMNDYRYRIANDGWLSTWIKVLDLKEKVRKSALKLGGLSFYAGGDNFVVFLPTRDSLRLFLDQLRVNGIKVGIGIARKPRRALELAAKSLDEIRETRLGELKERTQIVLLNEDDQAQR